MAKTKTKKQPQPLYAEALKERAKNITKEEFTRYVRPCGSSGHIGVSKHWVNKYVKVIMEEVKE